MNKPTNSEEQRHAEMNAKAQALFAEQVEAHPPSDLEEMMAYAVKATEAVVRDVLAQRRPEQPGRKSNHDIKTVYRRSYEFFFLAEEEQLNFFVDCMMEFSGGDLVDLSFYPSAPPFCHV